MASDVGVEPVGSIGSVVEGAVVSVDDVEDEPVEDDPVVVVVIGHSGAPIVVLLASSSGVGKVVGADGPGPVLTVVAGRVVEVVGATVVGVVAGAVVGVVVVVVGSASVLFWRPAVDGDGVGAGSSMVSVPLAATTVVNEVETPATETDEALISERSIGMATMSPARTRIAWYTRGPATRAADAVESATARKNLGVRITFRKESIIGSCPQLPRGSIKEVARLFLANHVRRIIDSGGLT